MSIPKTAWCMSIEKTPTRLFAAFMVAVILLGTRPLYGDTHTSSTATSAIALTPKKIRFLGTVGIWLPSDQMSRVERRLEQADALDALVASQKGLIAAQAKQIDTSSLTIGTLHGLVLDTQIESDEYKKLSETQTREIGGLEAWYHNGFIMGSAGLLLGILGTTATLLYLKR